MAQDPSVESLKLVYPDLVPRWIRTTRSLFLLTGKQMKVTQGIRTLADQWINWNKGRRQNSDGTWTIIGPIVTRAYPGTSMHQFGLALDSCFVGKDPYLTNEPNGRLIWQQFGKFAQLNGFVWGGDWNGDGKSDRADFDLCHTQLTYGLTVKDIVQLYAFNKNIAVWAKIDQIRGV